MKRCIYCGGIEATDKHHIIFRSQGGTDSPFNLADLCRPCHFSIHFGKDKKHKENILNKCYEQVKGHLDECWKGKIKPKAVRLLED